MSDRELDAAGITDPALRASYLACRRLNAKHGRTYYLATLLLPPWKRPHVHALYGFARYADDIVDDLDPSLSSSSRASALAALSSAFANGDEYGDLLPAVHHTVSRFSIPRSHFEAFLQSMQMDLTVTSYATYADLLRYMEGSAAVIGLQMLPVLGHPGLPESVVAPYARDLGTGFQLTNFIRDVGEDLQRGRLYLPLEDLGHFGVTRSQLNRGVDDSVRELLAFEVARARSLLSSAAHGIRLVDPTSRDCLRTALLLYGGILDAVERAEYDVLSQRVAVGPARRLAVALPGLVRAWRSRTQVPSDAGRYLQDAAPTG
ncbi:MAG: 15-cis-phytoene synthase [Frankiales bacterium]|nr:15-cis-phytoene synthase [Frankiales bacterium]